jgi:hypothetical protein
MAAPTHTYCSWASGNDYKGTTFTDGAYTSATKTLVKNGAFTANLAGHWLYLESNDGGSIVAGYYKIATVSDANTVILATDAGGGVDDDAAKCTQHDGTTTKPWRSVQGALDLVGRDATNGNQINIRSDAAQVNNAALALTTYGTPGAGAPLVFRGYTTAANDGGMGEIDANGFTLIAPDTLTYLYFIDLEMHNFGNNHGVNFTLGELRHCEVHKGASTPTSKSLIYTAGTGVFVVGCYIHDAGTTGTGILYGTNYGNYIYNCPTGINSAQCYNNIVVDSATSGILARSQGVCIGNSVYHSAAGTGVGITVAGHHNIILNNIIEGYVGVGGKGLSSTYDIALLGYNAFYNNETNEGVADVLCDLGNDVTCTSSPFTNAAAGDFSVTTEVKALAYPGAWPFLATTTNYMDIGAVQRSEPTAAQVIEAGGGTYHVCQVAEVLDTVSFGAASAETGTYHAPDVGEVIDTAVYGPASGTAGTFAIPAEADVKDGVTYGEDGTEFEGTYAGGGGAPVFGGQVVRRA